MPATRPQPSRRIVFRGSKIDLALQTVELADGTTAEREVVVHRGAVALVPMVDDGHVCLVKNDRHYSTRRTVPVVGRCARWSTIYPIAT